jgi:hypothetical protein
MQDAAEGEVIGVGGAKAMKGGEIAGEFQSIKHPARFD